MAVFMYFGIVALVSMLILMTTSRCAAEGYQDEGGFHHGCLPGSSRESAGAEPDAGSAPGKRGKGPVKQAA